MMETSGVYSPCISPIFVTTVLCYYYSLPAKFKNSRIYFDIMAQKMV